MNALEIKKLNVKIEDKEIIKGIDLTLKKGEVAVIMGPNGSGKSSLANSLMGHPTYSAKGTAKLYGTELLDLEADERSKEGLFLSFQYPVAIPGVTVSNFLRQSINARLPKDKPMKITKYVKILNEKMKMLRIPKEFSSRYLNEGFSGGEKKKMEILQLAMLNPKVAILDETDSGLDIDALKKVCEAINTIKEADKDMTILVITHYQRMLNYLKPDTIYVMLDGKIVKEGGPELAEQLEKEGYDKFRE